MAALWGAGIADLEFQNFANAQYTKSGLDEPPYPWGQKDKDRILEALKAMRVAFPRLARCPGDWLAEYLLKARNRGHEKTVRSRRNRVEKLILAFIAATEAKLRQERRILRAKLRDLGWTGPDEEFDRWFQRFYARKESEAEEDEESQAQTDVSAKVVPEQGQGAAKGDEAMESDSDESNNDPVSGDEGEVEDDLGSTYPRHECYRTFLIRLRVGVYGGEEARGENERYRPRV